MEEKKEELDVRQIQGYVDGALDAESLREPRIRKMAEKGREYRKEQLKQRQIKSIERLERQSSTVSNVLESAVGIELVRGEISNLDELYRNFISGYDEYTELCSQPEEDDFRNYMDKIEKSVFDLKTSTIAWIKDNQEDLEKRSTSSRTHSLGHRSKRSNTSKASSKSSTRSKLLEEKAKNCSTSSGSEFLEKKRLAREMSEKIEIEKD